MMPGTERALVVLTETMLPRLSKAISELTEAVRSLAKPLPKLDGDQVVTLALTKEQWIELREAVSSKATQVRSGSYGDGGEDPETDIEKWADELDEVGRRVDRALTDQGVSL